MRLTFGAQAENSIRAQGHELRAAERQRHLQEMLSNLTPPANSTAVCEVGCGHGHFLAAFAKNHPDVFCIGVDVAKKRIERAVRKRDRARLPNLNFVLADAFEFFTGLDESVRFSAVYVLFPDPWPKRRHHKNRLLQPEFMEAVSSKTIEGARLYFRTDFRAYFDEASKLLDSHTGWRLVAEPWPFEAVTVFQARAPTFHSLVAQKNPERPLHKARELDTPTR